jgi:hypothetical protein
MSLLAHQMMHGRIIAATETFPIVIPGAFRNVGVAEFFPALDIGSAVMIEVFAGSFNSIVKALALDFAELMRRSIPPVMIIVMMMILIPFLGCKSPARNQTC